MDAKIKTLGNFTAPALFTFGGAIPAEAANFTIALPDTDLFQVVNYGEDNVSLEVRLANHTAEESVNIVCFPGQPTFELIREIISVPAGAVLNWYA